LLKKVKDQLNAVFSMRNGFHTAVLERQKIMIPQRRHHSCSKNQTNILDLNQAYRQSYTLCTFVSFHDENSACLLLVDTENVFNELKTRILKLSSPKFQELLQ